jgi:uncharacterized protein (TIRG00374 family)
VARLPACLGALRRPWVRYLVAGCTTALVVMFFVVPQFRSGWRDLGLVTRIPVRWVVLAVLLEMASFAAYGLFTRAVLPTVRRPRYHRLMRIDVVGSGLSHVLPGGGAVASGMRYRLLCKAGVDGTDAAFGSVLQGVGSGVVVNLIMVTGFLIVLPSRGGDPLYLLGAGLGVAHIVVLIAAWLLLVRAEEKGVRLVRRLGGPSRADRLEGGARRLAVKLRELASDPALLGRTLLWSGANWLFDAASLWVFLLAFGHRVSLGGLLVAFGLAHALAFVPITPGGVGIIEGVLIPTLISFGVPAGDAVLGVLTWRLINFWAPIPAGALCWISVRLDPGCQLRPRRSALQEISAAASGSGSDVEAPVSAGSLAV